MLRFIMLICALVAASGAANAQQARDRLDGFNGVPFGTTFEQAKQALGSTAKADTKVASGGRKLNVLSIDVTLDGQAYKTGYIFGSGDRMTLARITPHGVALGKDQGCLSPGGDEDADHAGSPIRQAEQRHRRPYPRFQVQGRQ